MKEFRKVETYSTSIHLLDVIHDLQALASAKHVPANATLHFYETFGTSPKFKITAEWEITPPEELESVHAV